MAIRRLVSSRRSLKTTGNRELSVAYAHFLRSRKLVVKATRRRGRVACPVRTNFSKGRDRCSTLVEVSAEVLYNNILHLAALH